MNRETAKKTDMIRKLANFGEFGPKLKQQNGLMLFSLTKEATKGEITKVYRKIARDVHPDKNPNEELATLACQKLNELYEFLRNAAPTNPPRKTPAPKKAPQPKSAQKPAQKPAPKSAQKPAKKAPPQTARPAAPRSTKFLPIIPKGAPKKAGPRIKRNPNFEGWRPAGPKFHPRFTHARPAKPTETMTGKEFEKFKKSMSKKVSPCPKSIRSMINAIRKKNMQ